MGTCRTSLILFPYCSVLVSLWQIQKQFQILTISKYIILWYFRGVGLARAESRRPGSDLSLKTLFCGLTHNLAALLFCFSFFFYLLFLGFLNFFSNLIFLVVFLFPMWPFPWTKSYWQYSSSSLSLVPWNTCGMTKEGLQVMQSPTSFNKPCSPTPPTIPIALTQTELAHSATFFATWIRDQQSNVVQWRMFSLDSCKLPLPSIPNTKPNTNCKKNNTLDWSHPPNPPSNCRISRSFQHSWVL